MAFLLQQRLAGFLAGSAAAGAVYISTKVRDMAEDGIGRHATALGIGRHANACQITRTTSV